MAVFMDMHQLQIAPTINPSMIPSEIPTMTPIKHSSFNPTKYPTQPPTTENSMKQLALPSIYPTNYPDESIKETNLTQVPHPITDNTEANALNICIGVSILVCVVCILFMIFIYGLVKIQNKQSKTTAKGYEYNYLSKEE